MERFPYRLFALPIPTWQLIAVPMALGAVSVVLVYVAWIKLVWTHITVPTGVVWGRLGAYSIFYQTTLWSLAGFRIFRLVALSLGGLSCIAVAVPFTERTSRHHGFLTVDPDYNRHDIRCGGVRLGFLRGKDVVAGTGGLLKALGTESGRCADANKDFTSPASAQFWFSGGGRVGCCKLASLCPDNFWFCFVDFRADRSSR
jgi:hypothetical protein